MLRKFILPLVTALVVAGAGTLYFTLRNQIRTVENNLKLSRGALQEKILEAAELESQVVTAREESVRQQRLAEKEAARAANLNQQIESLSQEAAKAGAAQNARMEEIGKLEAINRELHQQINSLRANAAPPGWQDRQTQLQSRVLELQAEITSLRKNDPKGAVEGQSRFTQPAGEIIRVGPGGSFVVLDYGRAKGAVEGQNLVLTRNQQAVGLVHLTHITEDFSIAQILNSTNTGDNLNVPDIHAGDKAHVY